jgi:HEAT repeat protein
MRPVRRSRSAEALAPLLAALDRPLLDDEVRRAVVTAIALLRSEASAGALLHLLAEGRPEEARTAAENFHLYRDRPALVAQAQQAVRRDRRLADVLAKALAG